MKIIVKKDTPGFLAKVAYAKNSEKKNPDSLYAWGETEEEAKKELLNVMDMVLDYRLELAENARSMRNHVYKKVTGHALQVS